MKENNPDNQPGRQLNNNWLAGLSISVIYPIPNATMINQPQNND